MTNINELNKIVDIKVLEKRKESAEKAADVLCQKVIDAKIAYETALEEYTSVVEKIVTFDKEMKSYDKS
jgi:hypothetical protein